MEKEKIRKSIRFFEGLQKLRFERGEPSSELYFQKLRALRNDLG